MNRITMVLTLIILVLIILTFLVIRFYPSFGATPKAKRLTRIQQSPNYKDGKFKNPVETAMQADNLPFVKLIAEFLSTKGNRLPDKPIQVNPIEKATFHQQNKAVQICWLGHSTLLIKIDGKVILTDPVFSKRVSPFQLIGTKAFPYSEDYSLESLPEIDLVLISHDHYDHLDYQTISKLKNKQVPFVTTLGVGAHLEHWGISSERITELDWWDSFQFTNEITLTATPARHFSGRGITNRFSTLWASWVIAGSENRLFFGADSGYFPGFKTIGDQYGPFDLVMLECGQYSQYWPFIHMAPEETFQAANDLKAKILLPIHWGKYKLSIHPWTEPVERLLAVQNNPEIKITTPIIGQSFNLKSPLPTASWWRLV